MNEVRDVDQLAVFDENKYLDSIRTGRFDLYENEYAIVSGSISFPKPFMELNQFEQQIVLLYIDRDFIEPITQKKTENDFFISFIAAYPEKSVVDKAFHTVRRVVGKDREGGEITEIVSEPNPENMVMYLKLQTQATIIKRSSSLKDIAKSMREIMTNDGLKDEDIIERAIMQDAISRDKTAYTMQNRKLAIDIKGLKKPMNLQTINVYNDGGGKKANKVIVDAVGNDNYDLLPVGTK